MTDTQYAKLIKSEEDSICFYRVCPCCQTKVKRIGGEMPLQ
ncbi:MAG: CRISPR-associated endonuclease Cas2 [Rivularia sp. (in: cyanobacteria)]